MKKKCCRKSRSQWLGASFLALLLFFMLSWPARADTGPKPSVVIDFEGLESETYYVTLLSKEEGTGPWSRDDDTNWDDEGMQNAALAFRSYQDKDGYYYIGYLEECTDSGQFQWNYYPPVEFKILVYFPDREEFLISSGSCERYAFDSYYKVCVDESELWVSPDEKASGEAAAGREEKMLVEKNYPYGFELLNLAVRIILTIFVELLLAAAFGYRNRRQLGFITAVNVLTQVLLNLALNLGNYYSGHRFFVFAYIFLEALVFVTEALLYTWRFKKQPETMGHPVLYAFVANLLSFLLGLWLADYIPGIF